MRRLQVLGQFIAIKPRKESFAVMELFGIPSEIERLNIFDPPSSLID